MDDEESGDEGKTLMQKMEKKNSVGSIASNRSNSSQQMSASSSRIAKSSSSSSSSSSSRMHHMSSSEMKASSLKSDLNELKSSISEMKNMSNMNFKLKNASMEDMVDLEEEEEEEETEEEEEPVITYPESPPPVLGSGTTLLLSSPNGTLATAIHSPTQQCSTPASASSSASSSKSEECLTKFEKTKKISSSSASSVKFITSDGFTAEKKSENKSHMKSIQSNDMKYEEKLSASELKEKLIDIHANRSSEKMLNSLQEQKSLKCGEITQQENQNLNKASMKVQTESFTAEKKAMAAQQQRQTVTKQGVFNQEKHSAQSTQSNIMFTTKGMTKSLMSSASQMSHMVNGTTTSTKMISSSSSSGGINMLKSTSAAEIDEILNFSFDDLDELSDNAAISQQTIDAIIQKYTDCMAKMIRVMQNSSGDQQKRAPAVLDKMNDLMRKAWAVPTHGHELGYSLCNALRKCGGMDLLMNNCEVKDADLQFSSARLLEQCLTTENREHVVEHGLDKVVSVACVCTKNNNSVEHSRVGTGILEHLFKHSEGTCSDVISLGGLDTVLFECRKNDIETLRHCAGALANLSLYGGAENQEAMIKRKVPMWLFPLAFHNDDNIKYYACLAIAVLVANTEIEAAVLKSGTLDLVEPFVMSHSPSEFAKSNLAHAHGQNQNWLQKLVPVLSSKREEARNLAAFHFCMEAGIKKQQGKTDIFKVIGSIEPLKKVASCPNAVASKYAAHTLRLIGETVPHKLSQQVPLWSSEDVREWVRQIGFAEYANNFVESRVDGDLLLQLTEENLRDDIGIRNGIQRKRFERELQNLKKMADYSSKDVTNLNNFLLGIGQEFSTYTYSMLNAGVDKESIPYISEDQLLNECGIHNSIHRVRIIDAIRASESEWKEEFKDQPDKSLDVFISYRRSNGSQLASLLKVHLELRLFSVFIDVERLEAGKFDNNLLQSIKQARNFLLVLTPKALDRCFEDGECKDWVHREIVAALQSNCNIIPILDNFTWPEPEQLPSDMRAISKFNGVRWIHDYQDACVDKLERFMRGELNSYRATESRMGGGPLSTKSDSVGPSTPNLMTKVSTPTYQRMHSNDSSKGSNGDTNSRPD